MEIFDRSFQYGLPSVMLAVFCWAAWRTAVWTGANVIIPIRDRAIAHLDATTMTMEQLAKTSKEQGKLLVEQGRLLSELIASLAQVKESMTTMPCRVPYPSGHKPN